MTLIARIALLHMLFMPFVSPASPDTVFYDKAWQPTTKPHASYFRLLYPRDNHFYVEDYYLNGGTQMTGTYASILKDHEIEDGQFVFFDSLGNVESDGVFENGKKVGIWRYNYKYGNLLARTVSYEHGLLSGERRIYDSLSGKLLRIDTFAHDLKNGKGTQYFAGTEKIYREQNYLDDSLHGLVIYYDSATGNRSSSGQFRNGSRNGEFRFYYSPSGNLKTIEFYEDNKLEGPITQYDSLNGHVLVQGQFKKGKRVGEWNFFGKGTGQKSRVINYSDGKKNGPINLYHASGNLAVEGNYANDKMEGLWTYYFDRTGILKAKVEFKNGKRDGNARYFDSASGKVKSAGLHIDHQREGRWEFYFPGTETIRKIENYRKDKVNGTIKEFFITGKEKSISEYLDGIKVGTSRRLYENGSIMWKEEYEKNTDRCLRTVYDSVSGYVSGKGYLERSEREGTWEYYYSGSKIIFKSENYRRGLRHGEIREYYPNKDPKLKGTYSDGKRNGSWVFYKPGNKKPYATSEYENDKLNGVVCTYHDNGHLKRKDVYINDKLFTGKCYTDYGEEIPYFPLQSRPIFGEDIAVYIGKELRYPETAFLERLEGKVVVDFIVLPDGSLDDIQVSKSLSKECDEEALRIISSMTTWTPAQIDGFPISYSMSVPIVFWLPDEEKD